MTKPTNNPAPHAGEKESPAIPKDGRTPGMGAPPSQTGREPGTGKDREARPPDALDPAPDGRDGAIPSLPEPDVEGVGEEGEPSVDRRADLFKKGFPS
jgi:hypothetical protein